MTYLALKSLPAVLLLGGFSMLWLAAAGGGDHGVVAWLVLQSILPLVGGAVFVIAAIYSIMHWGMTLTTAATILASLLVMWPYAWRFDVFPQPYPISINRTTPSVTVRLPSDAPMRVAWGGHEVAQNYHALFPDQRWAYDLVVDPAFHGSEKLEDYGCWSLPVVAPVAGIVIQVNDNEVDHMPGKDSEGYTHPGGNFVFLQLQSGTHLVLAHLKQNSITVRAGETVVEGQNIGLCGNSGSTSEPHIHIHHQRQNPLQVPLGLAEGLPLFFRNHGGPPMPLGGGHEDPDGNFVPTGHVVRHMKLQIEG